MKRVHLIPVFMLGLLLVFAGLSYAGSKPEFDLEWYGYFKLDGSYDQNLTSHGNFVMWVQQQAYDDDDDQFNMTANQTRFGFRALGKNYHQAQVEGNLEFDLYANLDGVAENKAMIQLRHAYFSVKYEKFKLLAGQTWDMFSPLNPSTMNYAVLWGCGNTGYRRPQISLWYNFKPSQQTDVTWGAGFFRNIGSDLTPSFTLSLGETTDGPDDGTDNGIPSFQGQLDVKHSWESGSSLRVGVSGLWGQLKAETNFGNHENYESWGASAYWKLSWASGFGFSGEAYTGDNLGSYMGGILQNSTIEGVSTTGGWVSAWAEVSPKVTFGAGIGMDDPKDEDFTTGRSKNTCYYGNLQYALVPGASIGLEVSQWETDYKGDEAVKNLRAQTSFILSF